MGLTTNSFLIYYYLKRNWKRGDRKRSCKTREKCNFFENRAKRQFSTVVHVENLKFSRSRMIKQTSPLESCREI